MRIQQLIFPVCAAFVVAGAPLYALELKATNPDYTSFTYVSTQDDNGSPSKKQRQDDFELKLFGKNPVSEEKPGAWLGVAITEASEALASQLRLDPGVGLLVNYVTTNSPAAKAGLKENDVIVEFEGQKLVHPAQLRKLVAVRKDGDTIKIIYYRGGEKKSAQVTLGTVPDRTDLFGNQNWEKALYQYKSFMDSHGTSGNEVYTRVKDLQNSFDELRINQNQMQADIHRSIEDARRAAGEALRNVTIDSNKFGLTSQALEDIARGRVGVAKDTTLTVGSSGNSVRTTVKADDTGTYVVVANPKKRLTVHDPAGKLVFDSEIETPEQQSTVPKEIWAKVESMVKKMGAPKKISIPAEPRADL